MDAWLLVGRTVSSHCQAKGSPQIKFFRETGREFKSRCVSPIVLCLYVGMQHGVNHTLCSWSGHRPPRYEGPSSFARPVSKPVASSILSPLVGTVDILEDNLMSLQWNFDVQWNVEHFHSGTSFLVLHATAASGAPCRADVCFIRI